VLVIIRENEFVREFDWDGRIFTDSKYRTCELPFRADFFINRWRSADKSLRADMEESLSEFPASFEVEGDKIVNFLNLEHSSYGDRARSALSRQPIFPDAERVRFYVEIFKMVAIGGSAAWRVVGENRWFRVLHSICELRIDAKPDYGKDPPGEQDLIELAAAEPEGLYKWGIEMVSYAKRRGTL